MSVPWSKDEFLLQMIGIPAWEPPGDGAVLLSHPTVGCGPSAPSSGPGAPQSVVGATFFQWTLDFVVSAKDVLFMFFTIALQKLKDFFRSVCSQEQLGSAQQTSVLHMLSKHPGPGQQPLVLERGWHSSWNLSQCRKALSKASHPKSSQENLTWIQLFAVITLISTI